jgi:hypothetical protein
MVDAPKKLVSWRTYAYLISVAFGWAAYRLNRDYKQAGRWEALNVVLTLVVLCVMLLIFGAVCWYANRPEPEDHR